MRFPNIMLRIARISRRRCHSFDKKEKGISKIRVAEAEAATFEVIVDVDEEIKEKQQLEGESQSRKEDSSLLSLIQNRA